MRFDLSNSTAETKAQPLTWIDRLSDEDRNFLKRFILASGSLKDVAAEYKISYPTVRLRLDRLIEKIKVLDSLQIVSEFERQLRALFAEGKIDFATLQQLLDAYRADQERLPKETP
ncbi:MAG: DUF2089 family protein [Planctomycetaceae bacterium]